jgi:hypothetical protein
MDSISQASETIKAEIFRTRARLQQLEAAYASLSEIGAFSNGHAGNGANLNGSAIVEIEEGLVTVSAEANDTETVVGIPVPVEVKATVRKSRKQRATSGLPSTGSEFWYGVLGAGKKNMAQIVGAALKKLKVDGDEAAKKALAARASSWLYPALKEGVVKPAGKVEGLKAYRRA